MTLAANILYSLGEKPKMYGKSPNFQSEKGGTNLPYHQHLGPDGKPVAIPLAGLCCGQVILDRILGYSHCNPFYCNWRSVAVIAVRPNTVVIVC
jgi:hypothetical protein